MTAPAKGCRGLRIYGASDDLVELEGITDLVEKCPTCGREYDEVRGGRVGVGSEEIGCYDSTVTITVGDDLECEVVRVHYGQDWEISYQGCSPWRVTFEPGRDSVHIDAPDGTPVRWEVS